MGNKEFDYVVKVGELLVTIENNDSQSDLYVLKAYNEQLTQED